MKVEHLAFWVADLDAMRTFYETYFGASSNQKYVNPQKGFSSYFLSFDSGSRIELMHKEGLVRETNETLGLAHLAVSIGSKKKVDELTEKLRSDGFEVVGNPRTTGDGYYESVIKDPEGNLIELTV